MLITKKSEYAAIALIALAKKDGFCDIRELSKENNLSYSLIAKIFQKLAIANIVDSKVGPNGGFRLKRSPHEISLFDVFNAIQSPELIKCYTGEAAYCIKPNCPLKRVVLKMEKYLEEYLSNTTLDDLINN